MASTWQCWLLLTMVAAKAAATHLASPGNNYQVLQDHQVWEAEGCEAMKLVASLEAEGLADILGHSSSTPKFRVSPDSRAQVSKAMTEAGISYKVLIHDLASIIKEEQSRVMQEAQRALRAESCTQDSCPKPLSNNYMTLEQIEWYLKELADKHSRVELESIGKSIEGRDIWRVHIKPSQSSGTDENLKSVWLEGGLHAREWISTAVALFLIRYIVAATFLTKNLDVYVVPMANPDGYEYTWTTDRYWRKNRRPNEDNPRCNGVDLNRNWDYKFGVGASSDPCSNTYKGTKGFSEPETQALRDEMLKVSSASKLRLVLALHAYGEVLLYPWGWTGDPAPNTPMMKRVGRKFARAAKKPYNTKYRVGNSATQFYLASGATDDWAKATLEVPLVYTLELRDKGFYGFLLPRNMIVPTSREVWRGVKRLFSSVNNMKK